MTVIAVKSSDVSVVIYCSSQEMFWIIFWRHHAAYSKPLAWLFPTAHTNVIDFDTYLFPGVIYFGIGRKNPKLIVDGFDFSKEKTNGDRTSWACSSYPKTKCRARLLTCGNVVHIINDHNHVPKDTVLWDQVSCSKNVVIIRQTKKFPAF